MISPKSRSPARVSGISKKVEITVMSSAPNTEAERGVTPIVFLPGLLSAEVFTPFRPTRVVPARNLNDCLWRAKLVISEGRNLVRAAAHHAIRGRVMTELSVKPNGLESRTNRVAIQASSPTFHLTVRCHCDSPPENATQLATIEALGYAFKHDNTSVYRHQLAQRAGHAACSPHRRLRRYGDHRYHRCPRH